MPDSKHNKIKLSLGELGRGTSALGKVKNRVWTWEELKERLHQPAVGSETFSQYLKMSPDEQLEAKAVGGYVMGSFTEGRRLISHLICRSAITVDIDVATPEQIEEVFAEDGFLSQFEFFAHTSRKHNPEKPRWRVVLPMVEDLEGDDIAERYNAATRILASNLLPSQKESMEIVDKVSFNAAQLMYWPSRARDQKVEYLENFGRLIDAEWLLDQVDDWRDITQLPAREDEHLRQVGRKPQDPLTKPGIVGAFCRAYSITEAMVEFLPGVYRKGKSTTKREMRFTFVAGSSSNGARVYDDNRHIYSDHSSDPIYGMNCNAFDMVRVHLFGAEDEGHDPNKEGPTKLPSFKAMCEFVEEDRRVSRERIEDNYNIEAMIEDLDASDDQDDEEKTTSVGKIRDGDEVDPGDIVITDLDAEHEGRKKKVRDWISDLELTAEGLIKSNLPNIATILQNDPRLSCAIEQNQFINEIVTRKPIKTKLSIIPKKTIRDQFSGDVWQDGDDIEVRTMLEAPAGENGPGYGLKVTDRDLVGAVLLTAKRNAFHPVKDFLLKLPEWDQRPRIDTLLIRFLGVEDNAYTRAVSRLVMLAAVTRIFEQGHKFDFVAILEGKQGVGKSTFIRRLAMNWFGELSRDLDDPRRLVESMRGKWIVELGELSQFNKADVEHVKAFVSANEDTIRMAYARRETTFARQCIFMGTSNNGEYLKDPTGNRRFWPVRCLIEEGDIDFDDLAKVLPQLWAEALAGYRAMRQEQPYGDLPLYMKAGSPEHKIALQMQESRRIESAEDHYRPEIEDWLEQRVHPKMASGEVSQAAYDMLDLDDEKRPVRVKRFVVCPIQVWVDCLGKDAREFRRGEQLTIANALRTIPGWERGAERRFGDFGKFKAFWRTEHIKKMRRERNALDDL